MDTVKELEELKAKLADAEGYIFNLEEEIASLRQKLAEAESNIIALSEESDKFKK
jgi:predicted  nucleic acid-binding Zn-ribbon protein